jgi:hypothetical protein
LIFDDRGKLMSPTYSTRRGSRYRYYVSRALVRGHKEEAASHCRAGADDVERLVIECLGHQLSRPEILIDVASGSWSTETRTLVRDNIERVVVDHGEVQITWKLAKTSPSSSEVGEDGGTSKTYTAPLPAPRPRARMEIVLPGEPTPRRVNHALILAIARAKTWTLGLRDGKYGQPELISP